jgi:hypothetical protein
MVARKHSRRIRRTRRRVQRGAGWGFNGQAFAPVAGMAPEAARTTIDTGCDAPARPAPQVGGACGCMAMPPLQRGGGAGTGGYGFALNNELGKVYPDLIRGPCPSQSGGSMRAEPVVSYPSGYGYNTASAVEVGGGSAHYLEQVPYDRQCMGGGALRKHKKSRKARKSHKKSRHYRK